MDALDRLSPTPAVGERLSLRVGVRELIGFVTSLDASGLRVIDRRGTEHEVARADLVAARRVGVSLGRDPLGAPRDLLDALASRTGVTGAPWVCRLSVLLAGRTPPASVAPWGEWAEPGGVRARFEGEWVTLCDATVADAVAAGWWATRMGARAVQVRTDDPDLAGRLAAAGFLAHG